MTRLAIFAALSLPVIWVSRRSLRYPAAHGFARFFAFEAILGLIVLNVLPGFRPSGEALHIVSWIFLSVSVLFVVWGFVLLRRVGGFRPTAEDQAAYAWEETARLVTTGIYHYIRHPMYSSLLFLAWGVVVKSVTPITLALGAAASLAVVVAAQAEEVENLARFGEQYREYMKRTRRFVPFLL